MRKLILILALGLATVAAGAKPTPLPQQTAQQAYTIQVTHVVILSWTASVTPGVAGYWVYRGTTAGGESSTPLNPTMVTGSVSTFVYNDTAVTAGATYYYVVTAVASDGVTQSADSNEVSATVPSP